MERHLLKKNSLSNFKPKNKGDKICLRKSSSTFKIKVGDSLIDETAQLLNTSLLTFDPHENIFPVKKEKLGKLIRKKENSTEKQIIRKARI